MVLTLATLLIIGGVTYAFIKTDLLTAFAMLVNVVLSGALAFGFFEPVASTIEPYLRGTFFMYYEDSIALAGCFLASLITLRFVTNELAPTEIVFPGLIQQAGAAVCGVLTGYLTAGFIICLLQTLPWSEQLGPLGYDPEIKLKEIESPSRRYFPPDRVWLALMQYASKAGLSRGPEYVFDPNGTFIIRYQRFRRYGDRRDALQYQGEAKAK